MYDSNSDCDAVDCLLLILIKSFIRLCFHYSFQCNTFICSDTSAFSTHTPQRSVVNEMNLPICLWKKSWNL